MKKALYVIGGFLILAFFIVLFQTGEFKYSKYILIAGITFIMAGYEIKSYPKFAWVLLIIFSVIFILAMAGVVIAKFA